MNSAHDEEHKTQLSDYFRNLGGEVDASINAYKVELKNFFAGLSPAVDLMQLLVDFKADIEKLRGEQDEKTAYPYRRRRYRSRF